MGQVQAKWTSGRRGVLGAGLAGLAALLTARPAGAWQATLGEGSVADQVLALKPGEYLWAPDVAPEGPVVVVVSLTAQRAFAYRNGVPIGISTVSTGKRGHETPTGVFTILQKKVDHKSNLYNNAPMPFMQRLTWDGIAMHAGNLPGYPASHGCIRLPMAFAKLLYGVTSLGLTVIITKEASVPRVAPTPAILTGGGGDADAADPAGRVRWKPEKAPAGPVSIVISAPDKRLVVLRNGVEIGSAPVSIKGPVDAAAAYTLRAVDADGFHWLRIGLPGQSVGADSELSADERARLKMPEDFRQNLAAILTPGATVLVTADTFASGSSGKRLTVMTTDE